MHFSITAWGIATHLLPSLTAVVIFAVKLSACLASTRALFPAGLALQRGVVCYVREGKRNQARLHFNR